MNTKGQTLIEVIIALAFVAITVPVIFTTISTTVSSTDHLRDHSIRLELAQSQMESIKSQQYQESADEYDLISLPGGYEIELETSTRAHYEFSEEANTPAMVQQITVRVTGRHGETELEGFKVRLSE
ncbi:MAG: type IV pilus modification PilV family protein [Chloroflexota bacterium]